MDDPKFGGSLIKFQPLVLEMGNKHCLKLKAGNKTFISFFSGYGKWCWAHVVCDNCILLRLSKYFSILGSF